jgi:4-hydroxy-3-polyprenylbenzoate decarboxylase
VIYGLRLLQVLQQGDEIETHLVLSAAARATIAQETNWKVSEVEALASAVHNPNDIGASIVGIVRDDGW